MLKKLKLKPRVLAMIVFLGLQYVLGLINNLYVKFPDTTNKELLWKFAKSNFFVGAHMVLGITLLLGSLLILIAAYQQKAKNWIIPFWVGFISILISGAAGSEFVNSQSDVSSLVMGLFFIVAVIAYSWGIYRS